MDQVLSVRTMYFLQNERELEEVILKFKVLIQARLNHVFSLNERELAEVILKFEVCIS